MVLFRKIKKSKTFKALSLILGGILVCIILPVLFKFLLFKPIISLFIKDDTLVKSITGLLSITILLLSYKVFYSFFEKRHVTEMSFKNFTKPLFIGWGISFGLISMLFLILYLTNHYKVIRVNNFITVIEPLILFVVMGVFEEIIFRGIIFRITENMLGTFYALLISSLLFSVMHFANSGFSLISGVAIFLHLGLLTGILFSLTKNIWYPIFLHIGWNFSFVFYGVTLSGGNEFSTFLVGTLTGHKILIGGTFGPEDSIITILLSLIVFGFLLYKKGNNSKILSKL